MGLQGVLKLVASKRRGTMKAKIFTVILLACVVLSSSVKASPVIANNNQNILSSYFYRITVRIIDLLDSDDAGSGNNIVGGDADDYANGRTKESSKNDIINSAGRDQENSKK